MFANLTGWHALIVLAIILLIFGSAKLPALARGVGQSMRILREEVHASEDPVGSTTVESRTTAGTLSSAAHEDPTGRTSAPTRLAS